MRNCVNSRWGWAASAGCVGISISVITCLQENGHTLWLNHIAPRKHVNIKATAIMICLNSALIRLLALKHLFHSKVLAVVVLIMNSVLIRSLAEADDGRNNCSSGCICQLGSCYWDFLLLVTMTMFGRWPGPGSRCHEPGKPPYSPLTLPRCSVRVIMIVGKWRMGNIHKFRKIDSTTIAILRYK